MESCSCRTCQSEPGRARQRGPKSSGNGNMEESHSWNFPPSSSGGGSLVWCFPVPPIPIVLKRSFLFLLVCNACLKWSWKRKKEGLRLAGMGTSRKAMLHFGSSWCLSLLSFLGAHSSSTWLTQSMDDWMTRFHFSVSHFRLMLFLCEVWILELSNTMPLF